MSTVAVSPRYPPDDLLRMADGDRYELVNGELVERSTGWKSSWIGGRLHHFLSTFCDTRPSGVVAPADASYQCFSDDLNKVRKPDVSYIRMERMPPARELEGHCRIAPDLATEVISPDDSYYEVEEKVDEYLRAGVSLVWVINPRTRTVRVHRADRTVTDLGENDELSGEDVLPGFRCRVADLFSDPTEPGPSS